MFIVICFRSVSEGCLEALVGGHGARVDQDIFIETWKFRANCLQQTCGKHADGGGSPCAQQFVDRRAVKRQIQYGDVDTGPA